MLTITLNINIIIDLDIQLNPVKSDNKINANLITLQRRGGLMSISAIVNIRILRIITMGITIQYLIVVTAAISPIS